jgi:hypothetical protein
MAARLRTYNPGLATGVVLFFPFALVSIVLIPTWWRRTARRAPFRHQP